MSENQLNINPASFKYNMSFYYQSTIFYFIAFIVYVIIRGEFVEDSFHLITKDPIIYFFGFIVLASLLSLLYNLYKNKHLQIENEKISFTSRFKTKLFNLDHIEKISIAEKKERFDNRELICLKLKNRKRRIIIRPYEYENYKELIKLFSILKTKLESK
jgi:hypothetical protein